MITVSMADGKKVEGKGIRGDDQKIAVQQSSGPIERSTNQIANIHLRRPKRRAKVDLIGNLLGGVGFGFVGAEIGRQAVEAIRSDGNPGEIGAVVGGIVFAFGGGYVGRSIARHLATEDVTLKIVGRELGHTPLPPTGPITLPSPSRNAELKSADSPR